MAMEKKRKPWSLSVQWSPSPRRQARPDPDPMVRTPLSAGAVTPVLSLKSVSLSEWWLKRAQGKGLAVAGFEIKWGSGVRLFSSAEITKRHDRTTLETEEGITVSISGLINRMRTLQNGFSSEVCNHFLLGFPPYWEDYATVSCGQEEMGEKHDLTTEARTAGSEDVPASCSTVSFDDIPVSRSYDLLVSPSSHSQDCLKKKTLDAVLATLKHCTSHGKTGKEQSERKCETSARVVEAAADHSEASAPRTGVMTRSMLTRKMLTRRMLTRSMLRKK